MYYVCIMKLDDEIQPKKLTDTIPQGEGRELSPSIQNLPLIDISPKVPELSISIFERVSFWAHEAMDAGKFYGALAMFIFRIYAVIKSTSTTIGGRIMFKDWRTTLTGIIGAVGVLLTSLFGIEIPAGVQEGFIAVILFFIGLFAKDAKAAQ